MLNDDYILKQLARPITSKSYDYFVLSDYGLYNFECNAHLLCLVIMILSMWANLQSFEGGKGSGSWLLRPIGESNLQLFALVSIWVSSKVSGDYLLLHYQYPPFWISKFVILQIHDTPPMSVNNLKLLGDKFIKEQHYTKRDFLEAVSCMALEILGFCFIFILA